MSETGEATKLHGSLLRAIRTGAKIVSSDNYALDVDPRDYEKYVKAIGREKVAKKIGQVIKEHLSPTKPDGSQSSILVLAAGTGIDAQALQEQGYKVTATDISEPALKFLHEKNPAIQIVQADMNTQFPFAENSFDGVTILYGNRYIANQQQFLQEVRRVLKQNGVFTWPIFLSEILFWKLKSGLGQHVDTSTLGKDVTKSGFREVVTKRPPIVSNIIRRETPIHSTPGYVIGKK